MDIKLFSLCNEESAVADLGKKYIFDCVNNFSDEQTGFAHFTSQKRMLLAISQSLLSAEVIVIAVQGTMYNATKKLFCAALDIKPEENLFVMEQLTPKLNNGKIKPNAYKSNILFPPNAEILPTNDFINCGFAISSGYQHIIYLPIDSPKADEVVLGSLYDYLANISDDSAVQSAFDFRKSIIMQRTADKLAKENIAVAISNENISSFLSSITSKRVGQVINVINHYVENVESDLKVATIKSARLTREKGNALLGATVSEVCLDEENNKFAYIAIADVNGTKLLKVFADNDETDEQLLSICVDRLMLLLYNYDELGAENEESEIDKKNDSRLKGKIGIAIAGLTFAASAVGLLIALLLK